MPHVRGNGKYGRPTYNQAAKIVAKFGGEGRMAALLGMARITVYRWNYARPGGSDGMIPASAVKRVEQAARLEGIFLTPHDWLPERVIYEAPTQPQGDAA